MFGIHTGSHLPNEMYSMVMSNSNEADCLSLAISHQFRGFNSFWFAETNRADADAITIDHQHHGVLHREQYWNCFFGHHNLFPSSIKIFNATNCHWIPTHQLSGTIMRMGQLEELMVQGTGITFEHLGPIFTACPKITKLEFSYRDHHWKEVKDHVLNGTSPIIGGFKKLTSLKLVTCIRDAKDYLNDPWVLIMRLLTLCRDCVELKIEITYGGANFRRFLNVRDPTQLAHEKQITEMLKREVYPNLKWMKKLKSFVVVKFGPFTSMDAPRGPPNRYVIVNSLLLRDLLEEWAEKPKIKGKPCSKSPLERLWIQGLKTSPNFWRDHFSEAILSPALKTFGAVGTSDLDAVNLGDVIKQEERYEALEQLNSVCRMVLGDPLPLARCKLGHLPSLTYYRTVCISEEGSQNLHSFLEEHKNLQHLHVEYCDQNLVPAVGLVMPNLKVLVFQHPVGNREIVNIIGNFSPNIEVLHLDVTGACTGRSALLDNEFLSTFQFSGLRSLHIYTAILNLSDGSFLPLIIQNCPKLMSFHIGGTFRRPEFFTNFKEFLERASKLRELRLELDFHLDGSSIAILLKEILKSSPDLERLVILERSPKSDQDRYFKFWNHPEDFVELFAQVATEMKYLSAFCVVFSVFNPDLIHSIRDATFPLMRPSLWFNVSRFIPDVTDPTVPSHHYHEMVNPRDYFPPPTF